MSKITESDLLRLAMILENQGQTTLDKYLCKLSEFILFDSEEQELSSAEICKDINSRFQLQFDILEIEYAIKNKGKGRIIVSNQKYKLEPKVSNQLSANIAATDRLEDYIRLFVMQKGQAVDERKFLKLILDFLYYSFNSNIDNFKNIIGKRPQVCINGESSSLFNPTKEEIDQINAFLNWDNNEKNKLFYSIVSCSYEYCMITTRKNPTISKGMFNGKRFFLDTNVIFRMAGINKDERQFVIKSFVQQCREVGIKLCYSNEVLDEIYRVVDGQVNYIKGITQGQPPVSSKALGEINNSNDVNDFYTIYYSWCKEPQNKYNDYLSFREFLLQTIQEATSSLEIVHITNFENTKDTYRYSTLFNGLKRYKTEKRPSRNPSEASVRADINSILYVESLRTQSATSLWQINDYLVSADQILINWARSVFVGIPTVMIPSVWLSIILKVSGRTSSDDYKSYCMFMTLRQHRSPEDEININPVSLLKKLAEKTIDSGIKEKVISEIIANRARYRFENEDECDNSVEKAFDQVLADEKIQHKEELQRAVKEQSQNYKNELAEYERKLTERKTEEEYAQKYAHNKSQKKVDKYSKNESIHLLLKGIFIVAALVIVSSFLFKLPPLYGLLTGFVSPTTPSSLIWSGVTWMFTAITTIGSGYFSSVWKYLGSEDRKNKLYNKYYKEQMGNLNQ